MQVSTGVLVTGIPPRYVTWHASLINGVPKIIDITAEGVSLRITQRGNCESFLARNNYDMSAFIRTLRQQV